MASVGAASELGLLPASCWIRLWQTDSNGRQRPLWAGSPPLPAQEPGLRQRAWQSSSVDHQAAPVGADRSLAFEDTSQPEASAKAFCLVSL